MMSIIDEDCHIAECCGCRNEIDLNELHINKCYICDDLFCSDCKNKHLKTVKWHNEDEELCKFCEWTYVTKRKF